MIRIVLAGQGDDTWHLFRQPQWMAKVRETPEAATWPRSHLDIEEGAYKAALDEWDRSAKDRDEALACLMRHGAVEVHRA